MIYVDVILPLPLQNRFTYEVPSEFESVEEGMRVVVQFGKKNTIRLLFLKFTIKLLKIINQSLS